MSSVKYVVPFKELELSTVIKARDASVQALKDAIKNRGKNPDAYVVRDILPKSDLGLANEEWKITYTTAYSWQTVISQTMPDDKFIVLYGVQLNSPVPKTLAVKFYKDVNPVEVIEVENLFTYQEPIGFFSPLVWSESENIRVDFYGNATGDDYIVLRGFVAELKRKTIA